MSGYALTRDKSPKGQGDTSSDRFTLLIEDGGVIDELAISRHGETIMIHDPKRDAIVQVPIGALVLLLKLARVL